jgi:protein involved in polysaccharide export with SLBB domain
MTKLNNRAVWLSVLLFAATWAPVAQSGGRVLVASDVIAIRIVDHPELDMTTRVEPDGTINFPYIGRVRAAGRTEDHLAHIVRKRLVELKIVAGP